MREVPVGRLKQNPSAVLRELEETGEPIQVTSHGRPVALMVRVPQPSDLASLVAAGRVRPPRAAWTPPKLHAPRAGVPLPSALLEQSRAE